MRHSADRRGHVADTKLRLGVGCHFSEAIEVQQADRRGPASRRATDFPVLSVFNRVVA